MIQYVVELRRAPLHAFYPNGVVIDDIFNEIDSVASDKRPSKHYCVLAPPQSRVADCMLLKKVASK